MKTKITMVISVVLVLFMVSCSADYKKTKTGLVYKIISGSSKDSLANRNDIIKFNFIQKFNDSLLYSSYDKIPGYQDWSDDPRIVYSPLEVLFMMKKGDSAVIVQMADTLIKQGMQRQFPFAKKGDRINTYIKVLDIFRVDSIFKKDYNAEMIKDKPRQDQEAKEAQAKQEEEMHKQLAEMQKQTAKEIEENKRSGEAEKEDKEMQAYLASKKITSAKKAGGTYVVIKEKGNGEAASPGKFITVKYSGKGLKSDQVFDAGEYIFKAGDDFVIQGWHEGIPEFNKGGKGTLYIPGYLSYGKKAGPGGTPFEALIFDVEILNVSDTKEKANADKKVADSITAANPVKKTN